MSKRLEAVAALVTSWGVLADIGTDHAYVPIALAESGRIKRAIAMDVRRGPLSRARENIAAAGLADCIETRLSDGLTALSPGEASSIVIAGMGGELMRRILSAGEAVCGQAEELILQPQSDIARVREYLRLRGYRIDAEEMVWDGKYYPMLRAVHAPEACGVRGEEEMALLGDLYGPLLLRDKHPLLLSFLEKEGEELARILESLDGQPESEKAGKRRGQVLVRLSYNEKAKELCRAANIHN
ncbi:MAG: class I SAM-dependent methyltransferase [Muribaculaceae bacterium]|nr:class I SAM-dependent methyltransferase [Muribaculaceae bacterium]MCM1492620.1 class I SAM-dependent methyltransferase [Muribaculaceae bacterium]